MGYNKNPKTKFNCDNCGKESYTPLSHFVKKVRHFCSQDCYSIFRKEKLPIYEHHNWKGGITPYQAHRRWVATHKERMAHLKARRYAREKGAEGSHTLEEWQNLKNKHDYKCANCKSVKPLTKDHILPLSEGGSDYIINIQPLCRNCNSRKWKKIINENKDLLQ